MFYSLPKIFVEVRKCSILCLKPLLRSDNASIDREDGILYFVPVVDFLSIDVDQCQEHFLVGAAHFHDPTLCSEALYKCSQGPRCCEVDPADKAKVKDDKDATFGDGCELLPEMLHSREGKIGLRTEDNVTFLLCHLDSRSRLLVEEKGQVEQTADNQTDLHTPEEAKKEGDRVGKQVHLYKKVIKRKTKLKILLLALHRSLGME